MKSFGFFSSLIKADPIEGGQLFAVGVHREDRPSGHHRINQAHVTPNSAAPDQGIARLTVIDLLHIV